MSVEEKYKNVYVIKPFCKLLFGTNELPSIVNDDPGFFRRLNIIPFEKQFTDEQVQAFDKEKILTRQAIDYFGNKAFQEYLNMINSKRKFANFEENEALIKKYRASTNSAITFLEDKDVLKSIFRETNIIKKKDFYQNYCSYCYANECRCMTKQKFYEIVLQTNKFSETIRDGYECFKYLNKN